jgi:hypothetical protein
MRTFLESAVDDNNVVLDVDCVELDTIEQYSNFYNSGNAVSVDSLKIFHTNIRSFSKNFDEMLIYLQSFKSLLDIIVFSECWLGGMGGGVDIPGFDFYQTETQLNQNDGVVVYVNKRITATCEQTTLGNVYGLSLTFSFLNEQFNLLCLYRTFDSDLDLFLDALGNYYKKISKNRMCILIGDLNIDLLKNDNRTDLYLNTLLEAGLSQCINKPTRVTENSLSCIDHIFVRYRDISLVKSAVLQTGVTDHYSTALTVTASQDNTSTGPGDTLHTHTYIDYATVTNILINSDWADVLNCFDVDTCAERFINVIINAMNSSKKPSPARSTRYLKLKPWITNDLIYSIRVRDKLSKKLKNQPFNNYMRERFCEQRRIVSSSIKNAKREYYRGKVLEYKNNPKLFWGIINEISGRKCKKDQFPLNKYLSVNYEVSETLKLQVANDFNTFFASVGKNLASSVDSTGYPIVNDSDYSTDTYLSFTPVTELDTIRYIDSLRGGSAPGDDGVRAAVLKDNSLVISRPFTHLINLSLHFGVFPAAFKTAKVIPLFKCNDIKNKNNFRPISLLSVFSKVLERVVKDQLVQYLQRNQILCENQYGFRQDLNISDALFDVCRDLKNSINNKLHAMLIFLDLKKAFDSIDRDKLLIKLEAIGVRGRAYAWFKSYLLERSQVVSICNVNSASSPIDFGVVQGSTIGPVLFLIYINNLSKLNLNSKLFLFADDTLILSKGKTWEEVHANVSWDLMRLKRWLDDNTLSLNVAKTKFMPISFSNHSDCHLQNLKIHTCGFHLANNCVCESIDKVLYYKYLGVVFDSKLNWSEHIDFLKNKLRKYIFAFKQLSEILDEGDIKLAYFAYIQSLLSFGIIAWGGALQTSLQPLNILQKTILKIGFKKSRRYPTTALFQENKILTIRQLYVKFLSLHIYKRANLIFVLTTHAHNTRYSQNIGIVSQQLVKSIEMTNSFYIAHVLYSNICRYFNELNIFNCNSINIFKKQITEFLLRIGIEDSERLIKTSYRRTRP